MGGGTGDSVSETGSSAMRPPLGRGMSGGNPIFDAVNRDISTGIDRTRKEKHVIGVDRPSIW